ncbi:hypothetical protein [Stackebrandtia soli]|uniref:hypothetical protein n=1 Tax=Stackebrandtia soli TaxID=1892856 RepID=UPI0039E92F1E
MSILDNMTSRLLWVAARRWPAELRDDAHREWNAELAWLRGDDGERRVRRRAKELAYAADLAIAPPPVGEPNPWRERAPRLRSVLHLVPLFIGIGVIAHQAAILIRYPLSFFARPSDPLVPDVTTTALTIGVLAVLCFAALRGGTALGRVTANREQRVPLVRIPIATLSVTVGFALCMVPRLTTWPKTDFGAIATTVIPWAIATALAGTLVSHLARRSTTHIGRNVALGSAVLIVLGVAVAAALNPAGTDNPTGPAITPWFAWIINTNLIIGSVFVLAYAFASQKARAVAPVQRENTPIAATAPRQQWIAGGVIAVSTIGWAAVSAFMTPGPRSIVADLGLSGQLAWATELRWLTILLAAAGIASMLIGHRRFLLPVTGFVAVGIGLDAVAERIGQLGFGGFLLCAAAMSGLALAAWWAAQRFGGSPSLSPGIRPALALIVAVATATAGSHRFSSYDVPPSTPLLVLTGAIMLAGAVLALVTALPATPSGGQLLGSIALLAVYPLGLVATMLVPHLAPLRVAAPLLGIAVLALAGWRPFRRLRSATAWTVTVVLGAGLAIPALNAAGFLARPLSALLLLPLDSTFDLHPDMGSPLPGVLVLAGTLAAWILVQNAASRRSTAQVDAMAAQPV